MSEQDIEVLSNIRKFLIDISSKVYRSYEFFFQSENKKQRREIYNKEVQISESRVQPIVCKSFCELIKRELVSKYGYDINVISCDNDEFGHCDILVNAEHKYIINCLSDLELNQMGMMSKRFCSEAYCIERYPKLYEENSISFLTTEQVKMIDKKIGFYDGIYFDDVLEILSREFKNIKKLLKTDSGLRYFLIGDVSADYVDRLDDLDLLKIKFEFLCKYFNDRNNIIGHIELVRIAKVFIKKLFTPFEQSQISFCNCFFDKDNSNIYFPIFNTGDKRVRFIAFKIVNEFFLISIVGNTYLRMDLKQWNEFIFKNNVVVNDMSGSKDSISEVLRNKGVGVNILKHSIIKKLMFDIEECILIDKNEEEKKKILEDIYNQGNHVILSDIFGNSYNIVLDNLYLLVDINGYSFKYFYRNDNLVLESNDEIITYYWKDEGKYYEDICKPNQFKK